MLVIEKAAELNNTIDRYKERGLKVAFVATMGAIHSGHTEMMKDAKKKFDIVVCSIFVNPVQFNRKEDFDNYPYRLEEDKKLLEAVKTDIVFCPSVEEIYPSQPELNYDLGNLATTLEGEYRPGHFIGVVAVVKRLFELVKPDVAYFGEKDYQQVAVVKWLINKFQFDIELITFPTVRAETGLALSSRNYNLSPKGKSLASRIYKSLNYCKENWTKIPYNDLIIEAKKLMGNKFKIDYFEIVDDTTFHLVTEGKGKGNPRAFIAAYLEGVRLIDNMSMK